MNIRDRAVEFHSVGNNCAQSVMLASSEYTGLDDGTAAAISAGFGGGVRSGEICGAISGAVMVLGKYLSDNGKKEMIASETKRFVSEFRKKFGSVRCLELKATEKSCDVLIEEAAGLCEEFIQSYK